MAYLTQYSDSIPVVKFPIDQEVMTIGQHIEMDICIPEEGMAESHAALQAVSCSESYTFTIKSEAEQVLVINGEETTQADLKDGDWITVGGIEFQFTDDGQYDFQVVEAQVVEIPVAEPVEVSQVVEPVSQKQAEEPAALKIIQEIKEEVESMTPESMVADSHQFSRRLRFI